MKHFLGIREEWTRPLPSLREMFNIQENKCNCCENCGSCDCYECLNQKSSEEKKSSKKTSKKTSESK